MKKFFLIILLLLIFLINYTFAQKTEDSTLLKSVEKAIDFSKNAMRENAALYNGSEYVPYDKRIKGDPYFFSPVMQEGAILFDGSIYQHFYFLYDIVTDDVIINRYNQYSPMRLAKEKLENFQFAGHFFVRILQDDVNNGLIKTGFYDQLYNGKSMVLAKRNKTVEVSFDPNSPPHFVSHNYYFIKVKGIYYDAGSKNAAMRAFENRKKQVVKYLRQNKISFKKDYEYALTKAAAFYDQIN